MVIKKIKEYIVIAKKCYDILGDQKPFIFGFVILSIVAALTEGISVSLVVPILEAEKSGTSFADVPFIGQIASFFDNMPANEKIRIVAYMLAGTLVLRSVLQFSVVSMSNIIPINIRRKMSVDTYNNILSTNISFVHGHSIGNLLNGINQYPMRISHILINVCGILSNTFVIAVYLILMMSISYEIAIVCFLFLGIVSFLFKVFITRPIRKIGDEYKVITENYSQNLHETLNGMKLIRLSGAENEMRSRNLKLAMAEYKNSRTKALLIACANPFLMTLAGLFICSIIIYFSYAYENSTNSWITTVIMFVFLLSRLFGPVSQINEARATVVYHLDALQEFEEFTGKAIQNKQTEGNVSHQKFEDTIEFSNVNFSYPGKEEITVNGVNFDIKKGEMVAIVGPSGSGKTTLLGLLTNLYQPTSGQITIDGHQISDLQITDVRSLLGIVSQDVFIFDTTIEQNIAFGQDGVTRDQVIAASKLAAAHDFIEALPEKYDTRVGDRGLKLSGGQQQRLAIARLILRNPDILIFDEATSNLDLATEKVIQDAIETLRHDKTLVVIAHRLSTVKKADKIIVLNQGVVVEQGTHRELVSNKGEYWGLLQHHNLDLDEQA